MEILDLKGSLEFSPDRRVYTKLVDTPYCSISSVGWEAGQTSPIHSHPMADEIYHVLEGEGLFIDGTREVRLVPPAGCVRLSVPTVPAGSRFSLTVASSHLRV